MQSAEVRSTPSNRPCPLPSDRGGELPSPQAGEGIRTPGPRITSSVLWPTELLRRDGTESRRPEERHGIVELEVSRPADVLDLVVRGQVDAKSGTPTSCVRGGHRRRLES